MAKEPVAPHTLPAKKGSGALAALGWGACALGAGLAGLTAGVTLRYLLDTPQMLSSSLPGKGRIDHTHGGAVYYTVAGSDDAQPVILLHDFYPGASSADYQALFERLTPTYRVYALDWLGWGMSERPAIAFTGEFYAAVLRGFVQDVVDRPVVALATGRAAGIAVRAASDAPKLFARLVLIAPDLMADEQAEPAFAQSLVMIAQRLALGIVPAAFLSTRSALRWAEAQRTSAGITGMANVSRETLQRLYANTHQLGGTHALLAALKGALDLPMRNALALLEAPTLLLAGARGSQHYIEELGDLALLSPTVTLEVIPDAGNRPFDDAPVACVDRLTRWLAGDRATAQR